MADIIDNFLFIFPFLEDQIVEIYRIDEVLLRIVVFSKSIFLLKTCSIVC